MEQYVLPILFFLLLGAVAGVLLTVASKLLFVKTDETVEKITEALPGANCGGCGFSGCEGYANAVFYTDRVIFADINAVSESMTARRTLPFSVVEFLNGGAASRANINEFVLGRFAISVALYIGVFAFLHLRRNAHYFTQGYCYGRTAGLT